MAEVETGMKEVTSSAAGLKAGNVGNAATSKGETSRSGSATNMRTYMEGTI